MRKMKKKIYFLTILLFYGIWFCGCGGKETPSSEVEKLVQELQEETPREQSTVQEAVQDSREEGKCHGDESKSIFRNAGKCQRTGRV